VTTQSYRILAIGVNRAKGQAPLECAEKDATDIVDMFTGGLGPPGVRAKSLVGSAATRGNVIANLDALASERPDRVLLFFSGHGSTKGIQLADQLLCYKCVARRLRGAEALSTVVVLDTCHAGAFARAERFDDLAGVDEDLAWLQALVDARKGHRVLFATSETTLSREDREAGNGRFTAALLHALKNAPPDLYRDGIGFISDAAAFNTASRYMKERWGTEQVPKKLGNLGDFPMVRSRLVQHMG
jgi:hypothetical protein